MDISWIKKPRYSLLLRIIIVLTISSLFYLSIVRPIRVKINSKFIYPEFSKIANSFNVKVEKKSRRIDIQPVGYDVPRGFGIPFGGYFWLPLSLFIVTRNLNFCFGLFSYHLFLCIGPPFLGVLFIMGHKWVGTLMQVNEMCFAALFLFFLFVGINEIYLIWKNKKPLKS